MEGKTDMEGRLSPQSLLSIDSISVVGYIPSPEETRQTIDNLLEVSGYPLPRWYDRGLYDYFSRVRGVGAMFLGHRYPPTRPPKNLYLASFHANPNLVDFQMLRQALSLFKAPRVTRLDIAADLIHPAAREWNIIQTRLSENHSHRSLSGVRSSSSFGSSKGERQLIVYDKVLERSNKNKRNIRVVDIYGEIHSFHTKQLNEEGHEWLRIEARLRKSWIVDNHPKPNAFSDLFLLPSSPDLSGMDVSASREARLLGVISKPALYHEFDPKTRGTIREELRRAEGLLLPVTSPAILYQQHHAEIDDCISTLLGLPKLVAA